MPENISLRHTAQGKVSFYDLKVLAEDLDPNDCLVEVVTTDDYQDFYLRGLYRNGRVRVWNVVPCPGCQRPIAILRLKDESTLRICDAVQDPPEWYLPTPNLYWHANLFATHACAEREQ
jgi:hypothetical protein